MYLIKKVETWRCESESEAEAKITQEKQDTAGEVVKSSVTLKTKKSKGEIVDSWYLATIETKYNEEQ